jgi:hypothetical protein
MITIVVNSNCVDYAWNGDFENIAPWFVKYSISLVMGDAYPNNMWSVTEQASQDLILEN